MAGARPAVTYVERALDLASRGLELTPTEYVIVELLRAYPDGNFPPGAAQRIGATIGASRYTTTLAAQSVRAHVHRPNAVTR